MRWAWLGSHVAAMSIAVPAGLNAYPNALALRFFLAMMLSYAMLFAMALGLIGGMWPAWRAARLGAVEALRRH